MSYVSKYVHNAKKELKEIYVRLIKLNVKRRTTIDNIYHCCVQKTASQWIKLILSDPRVYQYSGLETYNYEKNQPQGFDPRNLNEKYIENAMPRKTIVTPLYLDFASFESIPKPKNYRAFFMMRNPRDIVVSWYFSHKYSHPEMGMVKVHREKLNLMSIDDGIMYSINCQANYGVFKALESWRKAEENNPNIKLIKFEDITGQEKFKVFKELFVHLDIQIPDKILNKLLRDYSFKKLSGARHQGEENLDSHYRKGIHGDWQNYFSEKTLTFFEEVTDNITAQLHYS